MKVPVWKGHFLTLDGLRGVAALAILVFHRRWLIPGGHWVHLEHAPLAVDLFFMLSGFVIAHAYERKLREGMSLAEFVRVRTVRLYPLLLLGGVLGLLSAAIAHLPVSAFGAAAFSALAIPAPAALAPEPFFINGPVWSLFFELVVNLAYAAVAAHLTTRRLLGLLALSTAAWLWMFSGHALNVGHTYDTLWLGVIRAAFPFLGGILLHRLFVAGQLPRIPLGIAPLGLALLVTFALPYSTPPGFDLICVVAVYPLLIVAGASDTPQGLSARACGLLGALSYPVYILHYPLYRIADVISARIHLRHSMEFALFAPVILALSMLALKAYDEPVRAFLAGSRRRSAPAYGPQVEEAAS